MSRVGATMTWRPRIGIVRRLAIGVRRLPLHIVVIAICLVWFLPALGLLVSSFRPPRLVTTTGWWKALVPPVQVTVENYAQVLTTYNMSRSFLNSLLQPRPYPSLLWEGVQRKSPAFSPDFL